MREYSLSLKDMKKNQKLRKLPIKKRVSIDLSAVFLAD